MAITFGMFHFLCSRLSGLLGMSGIIINDSIVLVTTIDEYAEKRGLFPAIIDATADRLRPVLLTTLTTVLGLLPLLNETSRQAQFLKPTVITLCYGLGFGLLLVLLVVPSLIVVQKDVSRLIATYRRGLLNRKMQLGYRCVLIGATLASLVLLLSSSGYLAVTQNIAPWIIKIAPSQFMGLATISPVFASFVVVFIGMLVIVLAAFIAIILLARGQKTT